MNSFETVAVIDVGSNSIKLLVAAKGNPLTVMCQKTQEFRISSEINAHAFLSKLGLEKATCCIQALIADAAAFSPKHILIVATSAVREATNKGIFIEYIQKATGCPVYVLSGNEEALGIARGVLLDPHFQDFNDFFLFDIGGGSLELIRFQDRTVREAVSLPLGAVRLMQQFVENPMLALPHNLLESIGVYVKKHVDEAGFRLPASRESVIGMGGVINVASYVLDVQAGQEPQTTFNPSNILKLADLERLFHRLAKLPLDKRFQVRGMPPKRADILPVALAVVINLAYLLNATDVHTSAYNLRFGLAASLL